MAEEKKLNKYFFVVKSTILKKIKAFSYKDYESIYINFKGFKFDFKK